MQKGTPLQLMCGLQRGLLLCSRIRSTRISGRSNMETAKHGWVRLRTATAICFFGLRVVLNTICISMPFYRNPRCSGLRTIFIKYRVKTAEPGRQEIRPGSVFCTRIGLGNCADIQRLQNAAFFSKMLSFLGRSIVLEVEGTVGSKTVDPPIQSERGYNV